MIMIIDAYNFLKRHFKDKFISETQRFNFISLLKNYSKKKRNNKLIIVFDGGTSTRPEIEAYENISVIYSGMNFSADDVIKNQIEKLNLENRTTDVLLISSDRELSTFAASYKVETIDPDDFFQIINLKLTEKEPEARTFPGRITKLVKDEENDEIDKLMQEAANISTFKEDDIKDTRETHFKKISKKEKKLLNLLKKL